MRSWGCRGRPVLRRSKAPIASLPRKHHPDANKNDPKSAARFSELNSANEIIGDEDKASSSIAARSMRGQAALSGLSGGDPRGRTSSGGGFESHTFRSGGAGPGGFGSGGFEDILNSMFGAPRRAEARPAQAAPLNSTPAESRFDLDLNVAMTVSLEESVNGVAKRVRCRRQGTRCQDCPAGVTAASRFG